MLRGRALSALIEIRTEALDFCFDAFSSREPVPTSLENAISRSQSGSACKEDRLSTEDSQGEGNRFRKSPTGPAVAPPRGPAGQAPPPPVQPPRRRQHFWSVAIFILLVSGVCIRAYRDLSQPEAWDYWKDQYVSPSMTSQVIDTLHLDGSSQGRRALFVSGTIGPAAANWF